MSKQSDEAKEQKKNRHRTTFSACILSQIDYDEQNDDDDDDDDHSRQAKKEKMIILDNSSMPKG